MTAPPPFDAVLFDLDGTLVATERFWPDAARLGARRAFAELAIERPLPSTADWMGLVGLPTTEGFDGLFPELSEGDRRHVQRRCIEAEEELLRDGRAAPLPGVVETLGSLRADGVWIGVASNCGRRYLAAMMDGLGLARWVHEARCLDSAGIGTKADMVADLLGTFGTRSAVMVGDRRGDRDAGWANGLPHVHLARGYAATGEVVEAEATIDGMDDLEGVLDRRTELLRAILGALVPGPAEPIAVDGPPGAGATLLARDLMRAAEVAGRSPRVVDGPGDGSGRLVWVDAEEEVRRRRVGATRTAAGRPEPARRPDLRVDLTNLLDPRLDPPLDPGPA